MSARRRRYRTNPALGRVDIAQWAMAGAAYAIVQKLMDRVFTGFGERRDDWFEACERSAR